ncbi:cytochrome c oxidase subunit 3 family protein [Novispirillum sp. DQ9]|uniref:cytochrome c oxidase subunit 3 family protein n=1 Tax=Novispirillum sp. DQ9 TaxID=3398612 RepID=UPI003C7CA86D
MTTTTSEADADDWGVLSSLPGNPLMWVLILSEILVFGALLAGFAGTRLIDPAAHAQGQAALDPILGGVNTLVLVTSGLFMALAVRARAQDHGGGGLRPARLWAAAAMVLGAVFLAVKAVEYADKAAMGIGMETSGFFTLYYLTTGFHAAHVVMGLVVLALVSWRCSLENLETGAAFWHMVDLVWVLIYPVVYLIR